MSVLDHVIVAGPDLSGLVAWLRREVGLLATLGGRHPGQGTHNALVGLGQSAYLELMAPDGLPLPVDAPGTYRRSLTHLAAPELLTWCASTSDWRVPVAAAEALGFAVTCLEGQRETAAGEELRWRLVVVGGHGFGGHVPFFIDWLDTPHPALRLEQEASIIELRLEHPDAVGLSNALAALGCAPQDPPLVVAHGPRPLLTLKFATAAGERSVSGSGSALAV